MKKTHLVFIAVVVIAALAFYFWRNRGGADVAIDLAAIAAPEQTGDAPGFEFRPGDKKASMFKVGPETIGGQTRQNVIFSHASSRLIFSDQQIPDNGRLRAWIAVKEEAWTQDASDGVLFRFGVDDGRYEELLNQMVDPRHNANDRGWLPVDIDLSAYAGQKVKLIFNTNASLPTKGDNPAYDFALWGDPAVVTKP
jgi:hypothetical protein